MEITAIPRSFATVTRLPFLARCQVRDPARKLRGLRRLSDKLVRQAWRIRRFLPASGEIGFRCTDGRMIVVRIDGRKHHFIDYASREVHGGYEPAESALIDALLPHTLALSTSKHGSNVAEQLLQLASDAQLSPVCETIFGAAARPSPRCWPSS